MSSATQAATTRADTSVTLADAIETDGEIASTASWPATVPASRLALLHRATLAFNSTLNLDAVLHSVLEELSTALQADGWAVWLTNPYTGETECVQSGGAFSVELVGQKVKPHEGALSWVIEHRQSINIAYPAKDPRYDDFVAQRVGRPLGSLLCVPLKGRKSVAQSADRSAPPPPFGVMSVISKQPATFDDEDLAVLEALAAAAAGAIENAQLYSLAGQEVEERRRAERALRYSESQYRTMVETSPDGIVVTDLNGIITNCNTRTLELHGFEQRTELLGKGMLMLFVPQCRTQVLAMHRSIIEGHAVQEHELTLLRKDESTRDVIYAASLVAGGDGAPSSIIGFSHDITDRRAAEDAIRRHNQELEILNRIATQISQVRDLHKLLNTVLKLTLDVLEMDAGSATVFNSPTKLGSRALPKRGASTGPAIPTLSESAMDAMSEWLGARLRESRQPLSINTRDLPFAWATGAIAYQICAVPLSVGGEVVGMLAIAGMRNGRPHAIQLQQQQLLSAIGHQVSVALENARLTAKVAEIEMLRELTRIRSELLAAFSHDLRTPLGVIEMACSTLQRDDITIDDHLMADLLDDIRTQTERLSRLVDGILDLGHLESGHLRLNLVDLDIAALLRKLASETEHANPDYRVLVQLEPGPMTAWADPDRIDQVVRNLLDNAVKYSPNGDEIVLRATRLEHVVRISVTDHGIGIPADQHEMVFERFYRVDNPITQETSGTGLGLATCRSIVEAHGGRIWVEPQPSDSGAGGTTFTFTLPAPPLDAPEQRQSTAGIC